ncbi:MAG: sigma-70 factor domain-containing protein, partial [Chloroflexota bacterium]
MIQELLNRAEHRGYITYDDVLEVLEEDGDDVNAIEAILYELDELGVEMRQEGDDNHGDDSDDEFSAKETVKDPNIGDINAVSADDPVGLYFRQMAQEPLLTAAEEISLAKRIEDGLNAQEVLNNMTSPETYDDNYINALE